MALQPTTTALAHGLQKDRPWEWQKLHFSLGQKCIFKVNLPAGHAYYTLFHVAEQPGGMQTGFLPKQTKQADVL